MGRTLLAQVHARLSPAAQQRIVNPSLDRTSVAGIVVMDTLDPNTIQAYGVEDRPVLVCCGPTRGVFISQWLHSHTACTACFLRRWFANLSYWEHRPSLERYLEKIDRQLEVRSLVIPPSAAELIARTIDDHLTNDSAPCHYIDLVGGQLTEGVVTPVQGCVRCFPRPVDVEMNELRKAFSKSSLHR